MPMQINGDRRNRNVGKNKGDDDITPPRQVKQTTYPTWEIR